jgi:hypothetical protein
MTDVPLRARCGSTDAVAAYFDRPHAPTSRLKLFNRQFTRTLESGDPCRI